MANYSTLKAAVADVVKTNGTQAITGANLQAVLLSIINSVGGGGYIFKGVATPSTDAGTPDENVFYIGGAGTYANFGTSVTVPVGSICIFKYNGSWAKEQIKMFDGIDDVPTENSNNLVKSGSVYNISQAVGNIQELETVDNSSLVTAVNELAEIVEPVTWWYGLTSANMTHAANASPIYFTQNTNLKEQNGTWLQGKTIRKIRFWAKKTSGSYPKVLIGYLPSGWTSQEDFVVYKEVESPNLTTSTSSVEDTESGLNEIDLNMTIPQGAIFGLRVYTCSLLATQGNGNGVVLDDYKNMSTNGNNYVAWTPAVDFAFDGDVSHITLRNDKTFAEQVTDKHTTYNIPCDFDLGNTNVTLPDGCILNFTGGEISNGSVVCQNTILSGNVKFSDITFTGSIANYDIYISWFGGSIKSVKGIDLSNHRIMIDSDITLDDTLLINGESNVVVNGLGHKLQGNGNSFVLYSGDISDIEVMNCNFEGTGVEVFLGRQSSRLDTNFHIENICVHDNYIYRCRLSVSFDADLGSTSYQRSITNCSAYNNIIDANDTSEQVGRYGIHLANASLCEVYNNTITRCQRHAIYNAYGDNNRIWGNYLYNNRNEFDDDLGVIHVLRESHNIDIFDNILLDNGGIYLYISWSEHDSTFQNQSDLKNIRVYNNKFIVSGANRCNALVFVNIGNTDLDAYGCKDIYIFNNIFSSSNYLMNRFFNLLKVVNLNITNNMFYYDLYGVTISYEIGVLTWGIGAGNINNSIISITGNVFQVDNGSERVLLFRIPTEVYPISGTNNTIEIKHNNHVGSLENYKFGIDISVFSNAFNDETTIPSFGTFSDKPTISNDYIRIGYKYFCTDKQTIEGETDGIEIFHKGDDVWVDALGRVVS